MNLFKLTKDNFEKIEAPERMCIKDFNLDGMPLKKGLIYKIRWDFSIDAFWVISPFYQKPISTELLKELFI